MSLIVCSDVSVSFGAREVFAGIDLRIERGDRLAVVGANGAGKTTLLTLIAGLLTPTAGGIDREPHMRIGYLPQDAPEPVEETVVAEVMASRHDLAALRTEMAHLEAAMAGGDAAAEVALERYGTVQNEYQHRGGYELEARAREALGGLGLGDDVAARHPAALSGGQKRRVEMAKLLVQDAELLLIDEPTNHLDLAAIEWLEEYMRGVGTAFVLVSHDRRFLDRVCTGVVELSAGTAEEYPGNYSQYVRLRGERRARRQKEFEAQQEHIAHQEEFIRKYKAGQRAKEARGRQKQLDRLDRVVAPTEDKRPRLRFVHIPGATVALRTGDLTVGRDRPLLTMRATTIAPGERIAVVGPNGCGKSTLLHTLAGELPPLAGTVTLGARTHRRLYRQDLSRDDPVTDARTVLEELLAEHPVGEERGRTMLGSLLFSGDDVHKRVGALSGGERARLLMGKVALEETNLLLLDEPTNHLDIPAQEVLESALLAYPGAIILVTHDRALIDAVATRTWAVEDGGIREVLGGYTDLLRARQRERNAREREAVGDPGRTSRAAAKTREKPSSGAPSAPGATARALEKQIASTEAQLAVLRERLLDPTTFDDPAAGAEAGREYDRLETALADLYERWGEAAAKG